MREKSSRALTSEESPQSVAVVDLQLGVRLVRTDRVRTGEKILQRTQHQREWSAELMTDIAEERCFRAIEFSQSFRAPPLFFISGRIRHAGGNLTGHEGQKSL